MSTLIRLQLNKKFQLSFTIDFFKISFGRRTQPKLSYQYFKTPKERHIKANNQIIKSRQSQTVEISSIVHRPPGFRKRLL